MLVPVFAAALLLTQSGQQFDLTCTGIETGGSNIHDSGPEAWSERYRIDLDRMVWCSGDCRRSESIVRADAAELVLAERTTAGGGGHRRTINRSNGQFFEHLSLIGPAGQIWSAINGTCQKADYTGIPTAAF